MSPRYYLRTTSAIGPMYYAGAGILDDFWTPSRADAVSDTDREHVRGSRDALCDEMGLPRSAVRVVRVGPKRRPGAATETARQRVDGTPDGSRGVQSLAARPGGACGPSPGRITVTGTWCGDSPVHEHAWQWRDGGLVCAHCGGRRAEVRA